MNHLVLAWAPGPMEILIIAGVVLLLFGSRLPNAMRNLGSSIVEFKKGMNETDNEEQEKIKNDEE